MLVTKREVKQTSKKLLSLLLAVVMIMTSMSVCFGTVSLALGGTATEAQWTALVNAVKNDTVKNATFSGEKYNYVFARSADLSYAMGKVLSEAVKPLGGKGGGRPDFAQGGGPLETIWAARESLLKGN